MNAILGCFIVYCLVSFTNASARFDYLSFSKAEKLDSSQVAFSVVELSRTLPQNCLSACQSKNANYRTCAFPIGNLVTSGMLHAYKSMETSQDDLMSKVITGGYPLLGEESNFCYCQDPIYKLYLKDPRSEIKHYIAHLHEEQAFLINESESLKEETRYEIDLSLMRMYSIFSTYCVRQVFLFRAFSTFLKNFEVESGEPITFNGYIETVLEEAANFSKIMTEVFETHKNSNIQKLTNLKPKLENLWYEVEHQEKHLRVLNGLIKMHEKRRENQNLEEMIHICLGGKDSEPQTVDTSIVKSDSALKTKET